MAKSREDLYDVVHMWEYAIELGNDWWLGTNLSTDNIKKHIGTACDVMGVRLALSLHS